MAEEDPIMAAVQSFYKKCYNDHRIGHWFQGVDPRVQERKMCAFACYAFGGEDCYAGRNLVEAHQKLVQQGMSDVDFDIVIELFVEALKEGNVPDEVIGDIGVLVEATRDLVLGRVPIKKCRAA